MDSSADEPVGAGMESLAPQPVLVTGAHGVLGAWLTAALLDAGHRVVAIRRDEPAASTLELLGRAGEVDTVHGDICDEGLVARTLNEYEVDQRVSPGRPDPGPHRQPRPALDL